MGKVTRAERLQQIRPLREQGYTYKQIGEKLGIGASQVRDVLYDPDGTKIAARRARYQGTCEQCGGPTNGNNGPGTASKLCASCKQAEQHNNRHWTPQTIIKQIQRFHRENSRVPLATDWLTAGRGLNGDGYPAVAVIQREFGSWANAIEAAGYPRPKVGWKPNGQPRRITTPALLDRLRAHAVNGVVSSARRPEPFATYRALLDRGISWDEACELAGVRPAKGSRK
jgi:HNH endonuclease